MRTDDFYTSYDEDDAIPIKKKKKSATGRSTAPISAPQAAKRNTAPQSYQQRLSERPVQTADVQRSVTSANRNALTSAARIPSAKQKPEAPKVFTSGKRINPGQRTSAAAVETQRDDTAVRRTPKEVPPQRIKPEGNLQRPAAASDSRHLSRPSKSTVRSSALHSASAHATLRSAASGSGIKGKKKMSLFKKSYLVFLGILLIAMVFALIHIHSTLVDYEASQPDNIVKAKLEKIQKSAISNEADEEISFDDIKKQYSPDSAELKALNSALASGEFTFKNVRGGLATDDLNYILYLNGFEIGSLSLHCEKESTELLIFPMTEWSVSSCSITKYSYDLPANVTVTSGGKVIEGTPSKTEGMKSYTVASLLGGKSEITDSVGNKVVFDGSTPVKFTNYKVSVPSTYEVYYGGKKADISTASLSVFNEFKELKEWCSEVPDLATYMLFVIDGEGKELSIKDNSGNDVDFDRDSTDISITSLTKTDTMPTDLIADPDPLAIAHTWSLFMSQDLGGRSNGFYDHLAPYLIQGSYLYDSMESYSHSVDITFTSTHSLGNPPFTNEVMKDFIRFSDKCFGCSISFNKVLYLNDGQQIENGMNGTFYFVYIDDTDDGIDNPHWAVASETDNVAEKTT